MVFIHTTCRDAGEAKKLGRLMIERRLACCLHMWPIESMYLWDGKIVEDKEITLSIHTLEPKMQAIEDLLAVNHSYKIPCVAATQIYRVNKPYKDWMAECVG